MGWGEIDAYFGSLCVGLPTRGTQSNPVVGNSRWDESDLAEKIAYELFKKDFKDRYGDKSFFISQYATAGSGQDSYRSVSSDDTDINFVLDAMAQNFRNWRSVTNPNSSQGFRKPDGLAISSRQRGRVWIEMIEVKPAAGSYSKGKMQLGTALNQLRDSLRLRQEELLRQYVESEDPNDYDIKGSPFAPKTKDTVWPLFPQRAMVNGKPRGKLSWICFKPTIRKLGVAGGNNDGIIQYEIHYLDLREGARVLQQLPKDVWRKLRAAYMAERAMAATGPSAWWVNFRKTNQADADKLRDMALLVSGTALLASIALMLLLAPEAALPIVFAEEAGVIDAAVVEETLVGGSYRVAPQLVRVATQATQEITEEEAIRESVRFSAIR